MNQTTLKSYPALFERVKPHKNCRDYRQYESIKSWVGKRVLDPDLYERLLRMISKFMGI